MKKEPQFTCSEIMELKDGTKLKVTIEKYAERLYPMGDPVHVIRKIDYHNMGKSAGTRYLDTLVIDNPDEIGQEQIEHELQFFIAELQKNPDKYKFAHATK